MRVCSFGRRTRMQSAVHQLMDGPTGRETTKHVFPLSSLGRPSAVMDDRQRTKNHLGVSCEGANPPPSEGGDGGVFPQDVFKFTPC